MDEELIETRKETRRLLVLALLVLAALLLLHFTPLKAWIADTQTLKQHLADYGWRAPVAFIFGSIIAIAIGVPRLALCGVASVLFGFVQGALIAQGSGVLGSYGAFLLARWGGRAWADRKLAGACARLRVLLAQPSIVTIFIARQLPVPGLGVNVLLGILPTRHRMFLLGTFLGYLPSNAIVALAGSSLGNESLSHAITQVSLSMAVLGALSMLLLWISKRR
jgi:uncharacterized membrane protein YdjX (TVP38/TMEM64 family)